MEFARSLKDEAELKKVLNQVRLRRLVTRNLVILESVDSTQSYSMRKAEKNREGDIVIGRVQTSGMGREGRTWYSQRGGLWITITLLPPSVEILGAIPLIATKSIVNALRDSGILNSSIKHPNDVYCGERKIAGVLAYADVQGTRSTVYLGMGVNVNNDPSVIGEISESATSLCNEIGHKVNLTIFTALLIEKLDREYDEFITTKTN